MQYNHQEIEKNWQKFWADNQTKKLVMKVRNLNFMC